MPTLDTLIPRFKAADRSTRYAYDAASRLVQSTDGEGYSEQYAYDAWGRKSRFTNKNGAVFDYEYDRLGRLLAEWSPAVEVTRLDDALNPIADAGTTGLQRIQTRMSYDAWGRLLSRTEAWGRPEARTTRYEYEAPVLHATHALHLEPRGLAHQRVLESRISISPSDAEIQSGRDYFGNVTHTVEVLAPHDVLEVTSHSRVEVAPPQLELTQDKARVHVADKQGKAVNRVKLHGALHADHRAALQIELQTGFCEARADALQLTRQDRTTHLGHDAAAAVELDQLPVERAVALVGLPELGT